MIGSVHVLVILVVHVCVFVIHRLVTVFVFVTTFVARTVERRVMRLGSIALSTRIGISKFTYFVLL